MNEKTNLSFGQAIEALKAGKRVWRKGWEQHRIFLLYFDPFLSDDFNPFLSDEKQNPLKLEKGMLLCTEKETEIKIITGWGPTPNDIFAEDYCILD